MAAPPPVLPRSVGDRTRPGGGSGGWVRRVLGIGAAVLLLAAAGDAALRLLLERRAASELGTGLGTTVDVELYGWPLAPRLLAGVVPRATVATPADSRRAFTVELYDLAVVDWGVADADQPFAFSAVHGRLDGVFAAGAAPLGLRETHVTVTGVDASIGQAETSLAVASASVRGGPVASASAADATRLRALLRDVEVDLTSAGQSPRGRVRLEDGLVIVRRLDDDALAVDMARLVVDLEGGSGRWDGDDVVLEAVTAEVEGSGVTLPGSAAVLRTVAVNLPAVQLLPQADSMALTSAAGTFTAVLEEDAANSLWPYPGTVRFLPDMARLAFSEVFFDVEVDVEDGEILLRPRLPEALRRVLAEDPSLSVALDLPDGVVLEDAETGAGVLFLRGSAAQVELRVSGQTVAR